VNRERFLGRLGRRLRDAPALPEGEPYRPREAPPRRELVERFTKEAEAVGAAVYVVSSLQEARREILKVLTGRGVSRVIREASPELLRMRLDTGLIATEINVTVAELDAKGQGAKRLRTAAFEAGAGITTADFGIASTGTLALLAAPGRGRAVSLLPPIHVALLSASRLVYELATIFERLGEPPSALTLVTGPSRTGDIELVLTVGVHGPKELHVFILDEEDSGSRTSR
jgi:L-lactate dehydrogenase complex protein LldG